MQIDRVYFQSKISGKKLKRFIGQKVKVLVDTSHLYPLQLVGGGKKKGYGYIGRTEANAPEIDGLVYLRVSNIKLGDYLTAKVINASDYDLFAVKD